LTAMGLAEGGHLRRNSYGCLDPGGRRVLDDRGDETMTSLEVLLAVAALAVIVLGRDDPHHAAWRGSQNLAQAP
jgi:hypothetical protein